MATRRVGALVVLDDNMPITHAQAIANLALQRRLPSSGFTGSPSRAVMMAYGVSVPSMFHRAAAYGTKFQGRQTRRLADRAAHAVQPVINLKTAKALGCHSADNSLLRADEVIE